MKQKKSFTLSEIMIAIAIIGIVAALVIPVFIDVTNGLGYKAKFKKTITTLEQNGYAVSFEETDGASDYKITITLQK